MSQKLNLKQSEHQIQSAFFKVLFYQYKAIYSYFFAIPNGGKRNINVGKKLKAEGVKPGVSDVFCMIPIGRYHGLWLEFKSAKGSLSDNQKGFFELAQLQDYAIACVRSVDEAFDVIGKYLKEEDIAGYFN